MNKIECITIDGRKVQIPREKLQFRPSVYAIIVNENKILLLNTRSTGNFSLPGGGVDIGEPMVDALKREVREETGIEIDIGDMVFFSEEFFYYEPTDEAFHSFRFFYNCRPVTLQLVRDDQVDDGEVEKPRWIELEGVGVEDFQHNGREILESLDRPF